MLRLARLLATIVALAVPAQAAPPARVVSINLCTDQLAMLLARPGQLVAVSRVAADPVASAVWREAAAYPAVPADAEAIHRLAPDLVLAGAYDPPATLALARRLGLRVETFGLDASFADIRASVTRMGALLGNAAGAAALLAAMDQELAAPPAAAPRPRAALYYANGYTSGAGTLEDEVLTLAGYTNIARRARPDRPRPPAARGAGDLGARPSRHRPGLPEPGARPGHPPPPGAPRPRRRARADRRQPLGLRHPARRPRRHRAPRRPAAMSRTGLTLAGLGAPRRRALRRLALDRPGRPRPRREPRRAPDRPRRRDRPRHARESACRAPCSRS